jgi:predicted nucleic acid-binding protein
MVLYMVADAFCQGASTAKTERGPTPAIDRSSAPVRASMTSSEEIQARAIQGQHRRLTPDLVPDAHLAALALEHGLTVYSTDGDFARFPGLAWENPLA